MKAVVISLDTELALGFHDTDYEVEGRDDLDHNLDERVEKSRDAWAWLVDRFETYSIPCTWAIVGHLFLDGCDGTHVDHRSIDGWFDSDPGGDETTAPGWFSPSLIRAIEASTVDHEIASHTFSHVEIGHEKTTREIAKSEVKRSREVVEQWGHSLDTVVFPRDNIGHRNVLSEYGVSAYRGHPPDRWFDDIAVRQVGKALSYTLGRAPPPIVQPAVDSHGLVNIPGSMHLFSFEGPARRAVETVTEDPIIRKVRLGLSELSRRDDGILHFWLHPNEVLADEDFDRLERVFKLVDRYRTDHGIPVRTMDGVASRVRSGE